MKNKLKTIGAAMIMAVITFSFSTIEGEKKEIKTDRSSVIWKGYKVTGSHNGNISLKSGHLIFNEGKLVGGEFVMYKVNTSRNWKGT